MTWKNITFEREGQLAYVTMNRPERRNALSLEHLQELLECFRGLGEDKGVRVVILRGKGPAFSAGHDLSEMIDRPAEFYEQLFRVCTDVMETIHALAQPVIAEVHGVATAAGCQLAAACDLVMASSEARFATPGIKIGLFCSTPMVEVSRAVGAKKAMEMLLTGELISAQDAQAAGLVNRVVPAAELAKATKELAEKIAGYSASVLALGKRAFWRQLQLPREAAYEHTQEVMCSNARAPDAQEGMSAFLAKRAPKWTGR
jgi:enoyl-CoA hydratase/carnithine racemase